MGRFFSLAESRNATGGFIKMGVKVEDLEEKYVKKLTVEIPAEDFDKEVKKVYQRQRGRISIPGFRKGKAPQFMIEKMYGESIFFEDATNNLLPDAYSDAAKESGLDIVSRPEIDILQIGHGKNVVFTATVAIRPEVELGDYKGIEVPKFDTEVTDEDVEKALEAEQKKDSRTIEITDRPVQSEDTVTIDYAGKVDGTLFEGGSAENYDLKIGSGSFIPGFEDQLIGWTTGQEGDIHVTFPEDYHAENLKGKEAVFTVIINKITAEELPALDDEYAGDKGFDTLEEYKKNLKEELQTKKAEQAKQARKDNALPIVVKNASIEMPKLMIDTEAEEMVNNFARSLQAQGMSMDQYMKYTSQNPESMKEQVRPQAENNLKTRLTMEKIVETENITVSDEELDQELQKMATQYQTDLDKIKELLSEDQLKQIRSDLEVDKAIEYIGEQAIEVEKKEEKTEEEE